MRFNRESKTPTDLSLNISLWCQQETHHEFQELGKHQKLCLNYEQLTITDLHMNRYTENQIDALIIICFLQHIHKKN